jgi:hypothetical protein
MVYLECGECGALYGMSKHFNDERRKDGKGFYCINGHSRAYRPGESAEDKLRREVFQREHELASVRRQLADANVRASRFKCPHCTRDYATQAGALKHLRETHQTPLRLASNAGPDALNSKVS